LKIIYRPPFQQQDFKPEDDAMGYTLVKQIRDWRMVGIIKNLTSETKSRLCRDPDNLWVRVRRATGNETATITYQKFPPGVMIFGAIEVGFKSEIIRCAKGVNPAEYVGIVLSLGLPERANDLLGPEN
jgi:hypothetical protein